MRFRIPFTFSKKNSLILAGVTISITSVAVYLWFKNHKHLSEDSHLSYSSHGSIVSPGKIETYIKVPGTIDFHPKHALRIHPSFPGIVIKTFKNLGDSVNAGETLATIESNVGIQTLSVSSPIKGQVLSKNAGEGQSVNPEDEIFSIGETSLLQAKIFIPAIDLNSIKLGQSVILASEHDSITRANIGFISPILSEETRSATGIIDFTSESLIPGMFVTAAVVQETNDIPLSLPAKFCQNQAKRKNLIKVSEHGPSKVTVTFGRQDYFTCEVLSGLEKNDEIYESISEIIASNEEHHHDEGEAHED